VVVVLAVAVQALEIQEDQAVDLLQVIAVEQELLVKVTLEVLVVPVQEIILQVAVVEQALLVVLVAVQLVVMAVLVQHPLLLVHQ
jgi:hypothetical protein